MKEILNNNLSELYDPIIKEYVYNQLPINIFVSDKNGYIVWGNDRVIEALNETRETFIGKHLSAWGEKNWDNCKKVIETGIEYKIEEIGIDNHIYLTNRKPFYMNGQSEVSGVIGVSLDITEQKQAERAKEAFVMNMAHDIRTPFSAIVGLAQCQAMYGLKTPEEVKDNGTMIYQSGNQLLEILDSVIIALEKNNIDDIKKDKIDLYEFAQEMEELIKPSISINGLEFELQVDKNMGEIVSDKLRLKQILANLLSNAVKFTPNGKVTLSFERTIDKLKIEVSDTGIGIDKNNHERIFEKYEKIKPSYKSSEFTGVGMGLYLVKQLVEKLNGKVNLTSSLGNGSTFQIEIPPIA